MKWEEKIMKSKRSFCNKTLFYKNIKRFWPVWISYSLILFLALPTVLFDHSSGSLIMPAEYASQEIYHIQEYISECTEYFTYIILIYAIIVAVALNSYLYSPNSVSFFGGLPVRKGTILSTNIISAHFMLIIPNIVMTIISIIITCVEGNNVVAELLQWLLISTIQVVFLLSFAFLCTIMTGQKNAAIVFYTILISYMSLMAYPINQAITPFIYGYSENIYQMINKYSPIRNLTNMASYQIVRDSANESEIMKTSINKSSVLVFIILAILFFAATIILFERRKAEKAGDTIAFRFVRPVFRWGVGISAMLAGNFLFSGFYPDRSIVVYAVSGTIIGVIGFLVAEILMEKSIKVFKRCYKEMLVFALACIGFFAIIGFDVFGIASKLPDTEDVAVATIYVSGKNSLSLTDRKSVV